MKRETLYKQIGQAKLQIERTKERILRERKKLEADQEKLVHLEGRVQQLESAAMLLLVKERNLTLQDVDPDFQSAEPQEEPQDFPGDSTQELSTLDGQTDGETV